MVSEGIFINGEKVTFTPENILNGDISSYTEAIGEATQDWLDEHLEPGGSVPIDDTLTIAGAAADAEKTGDEIAELKSGLNGLDSSLYAIDDSTAYWQQGDWSRSTGTKNTSHVSYIGTPANVSLSNVARIVAENENLTLILLAFNSGQYVGWYYNGAFTTDETIDDRTNGMQVVDLNSFRKAYPAYTFKVNCLSKTGSNVYPSTAENNLFTYVDNIIGIKQELNTFGTDVARYSPVWENLFNPNDADIVYGAYVNTDNGNMVASSSCNTSGYIPIVPNQYYATRVLYSYMGANNAKYIIYYNENKERIGQQAGTYLEDSGTWRALKFRIANTAARYVRISYSTSNTYFMVVEGETYPTEYKPYGMAFKNIIGLNDNQLKIINTIIEQQTGGSNILYGKHIAYNGDSICESRLSAGNTYNGGAYAKLIADIVGGTYENRAIGGGILASAVGDGGSVPSRCVVSDITNMADDADMVCFEGGINDYWRKVPLGTLTAESDLTGTVDTTTIIGALESIFRQAKTKWSGKPICFVIAHKIQNTYYTQNTAGYSWKDVHDAIVSVCNKYAIPYYDACLESGLNGHDSEQSNAYLTSNTNGTGDGCHPNEEGYRRYYVPQLISFFESIMPRLS